MAFPLIFVCFSEVAHIGPNKKLRLLTSFKCSNAKREHQNIIIPMWLDMEVVQKNVKLVLLFDFSFKPSTIAFVIVDNEINSRYNFSPVSVITNFLFK